MLPDFLPHFSVGPFFGLAANAILVILCAVTFIGFPGYRPLRGLTLFNFFITTAFLGWVIYGLQGSPESILLGNRLLYASFALLPATWFWLQLSLLGEKPSRLTWVVAAIGLLLFMLALWGGTPLLFDLPLERDPITEGILRPKSSLLKPAIQTYCLGMCLYFLFSILKRVRQSGTDKPIHLMLMAVGLSIWMLGGLHDALLVAGITVLTQEYILWFASFWLSVFLAMAVALHFRVMLSALNKSKERAINHLAHELKTPLSVISSCITILTQQLQGKQHAKIETILERGKRNVQRLFNLQTIIDDILLQRGFEEEKAKILPVIEDAVWLASESAEGTSDVQTKALLQQVSNRLEAFLGRPEPHPERISLDKFLHEVCADAVRLIGSRDLEIRTDFQDDLLLVTDREVLWKVCTGLLRNAIENTPDEGRIEVQSRWSDGEVTIHFQDYGVGITPENQLMIFSGFFHTQETNHYATRKPYQFNAGGAGADLLRTKIFSERFGFQVDFTSRRCRHIPSDQDACPGRISKCSFVKDKTGCMASGGSTFSITFLT